MTSEEFNFVEWVFKITVGGLFALGAYLWSGLVSMVKDIRKSLIILDDELEAHKVEVAKTYAERGSLDRIHDRIDAVQKDTNDIKTLLITNFSNHPRS